MPSVTRSGSVRRSPSASSYLRRRPPPSFPSPLSVVRDPISPRRPAPARPSPARRLPLYGRCTTIYLVIFPALHGAGRRSLCLRFRDGAASLVLVAPNPGRVAHWPRPHPKMPRLVANCEPARTRRRTTLSAPGVARCHRDAPKTARNGHSAANRCFSVTSEPSLGRENDSAACENRFPNRQSHFRSPRSRFRGPRDRSCSPRNGFSTCGNASRKPGNRSGSCQNRFRTCRSESRSCHNRSATCGDASRRPGNHSRTRRNRFRACPDRFRNRQNDSRSCRSVFSSSRNHCRSCRNARRSRANHRTSSRGQLRAVPARCRWPLRAADT